MERPGAKVIGAPSRRWPFRFNRNARARARTQNIENNPMQSRNEPGSRRPYRPRPDPGWSVFTVHPDLNPALAVVFAPGLFDGHNVGGRRASREGRQRLDRLFAPLGDRALVGEADPKPE